MFVVVTKCDLVGPAELDAALSSLKVLPDLRADAFKLKTCTVISKLCSINYFSRSYAPA